VFNPELHIENQILKKKYENELEEVYSQFGRKYHRVEEPQTTTRWKYLLKQIEEAGRDFASEREERIKLKRKIAKFAQSTCNRL
jgi:tRNA A22 N-methylase